MTVKAEPCTTPSASKLHYSDQLASPSGARTLCGLAGAKAVQTFMVEYLPPCKTCERSMVWRANQ